MIAGSLWFTPSPKLRMCEKKIRTADVCHRSGTIHNHPYRKAYEKQGPQGVCVEMGYSSNHGHFIRDNDDEHIGYREYRGTLLETNPYDRMNTASTASWLLRLKRVELAIE